MTKAKKKLLGRPRRAEASTKAMAALAAAGIDAATVDPRLILQSIAADPSAPATARVAACRALLQASAANDAENSRPHSDDAVSARAKILMRKYNDNDR